MQSPRLPRQRLTQEAPVIRLVLFAALVLGLAAPLSGCKNACEKAADKLIGCMEELCDTPEGSGDPSCERQDEVEEQIRASMPEECTGTAEERSAALLEMSCDDIRGGRYRD
jgi:hypothetical protein